MAASGVVLVANLGVLLIEIVNKLELKKYIPSQLFSKNENKTNHPFFVFSFRIFLYLIVLFGVYFGILLVLIASDNSGTSHAEKFIERTENGDVKMKAVRFKNNADDYTEFSVICNDAQYSYFKGGQSTVINNRDVLMVTSGKNSYGEVNDLFYSDKRGSFNDNKDAIATNALDIHKQASKPYS